MGRRKPKDLPLEVAGIDWRALKKGDSITAEKVNEMWDILFAQNRKKDQQFVSINVKEWLDSALKSIGKEMVLRESKGILIVLTDEQAVGYLEAQANQGLRKHKNNTRRMFTAIDQSNLSQHQRDQLTTNQAKHALISSSAEGAKKQAMSLIKQGAKLPKLRPPEED